MRILCGGCDKNFVLVMCCVDEVVLCIECDVRVYVVNKYVNKCVCVVFCLVLELIKCDIC